MARHFVAASSQRLERTQTIITGYAFTMACWVRPTTVTATQTALSICAAGSQNYHALGITSAAKILYEAEVGASSLDAIGTTNITAGAWHHLLATGQSATNRACYRDGVLDGTSVTSGTPASITRVEIGCILNNASYASFFNGDIAECAMWNVSLTLPEITMLSLGVSPLLVRPSALVFYAPLMGTSSPEQDYKLATGMALTNAPTQIDHPRVLDSNGVLLVPKTVSSNASKSGTDANGVTTEVIHPFILTVADVSGTTTEIASASVPISVSDANGTTTESASVTGIKITDSDSGGTATTIGQNVNTGVGTAISGPGTGNVQLAQSFVPPFNCPVANLQLGLWFNGAPTDNLVIEIQGDSAGNPSGTALAQQIVAASTINAFGWYTFAGGTIAGLNLVAGTTYWIVLYRSGAGDSVNRITWYGGTGDLYPSGVPKRYGGSSWLSDGTNDRSFIFTPNFEIASVTLPTPISGTDANGTTTESASVVTRQTVSDTDAGAFSDAVVSFSSVYADVNGATTEATTLAAKPIAADANGTVTEISTLVSQASVSDVNGAVTETASPVVAPSVTENNGTTTENASVVATATVIDSGTATDTGSATGATTPISGSDSGASTETAAVTFASVITDTNGTTTEVSTLTNAPVVIDAGTGVEAFVYKVVITPGDTGTASLETATTNTPINGADTGAGVEAFVLKAVESDTDSGAGSEAVIFTYRPNLSDANGTTTEIGSLIIGSVTTDTGSGAETGSGTVKITVTEIGTVSFEAGSLNVANSIVTTDGGVGGSERLFLAQTAFDQGSASDAASVSLVPGVFLTDHLSDSLLAATSEGSDILHVNHSNTILLPEGTTISTITLGSTDGTITGVNDPAETQILSTRMS